MRNRVHKKFGVWKNSVVIGGLSLKFFDDGVVITLRSHGTFELWNHQAGDLAVQCRHLAYPLLRTPVEMDEFFKEKMMEEL